MEPGGRRPAPHTLRPLQLFINTYNIERHHLGLRQDEFVSPTDLRRWLAGQGLLRVGARVSESDLSRAVEVREALRRLVLAHNRSQAHPSDVRILDRLAR